MTSSWMREFPVSEYQARVVKLNEGMRAAGIDAVILTTKENLRYFSGFQSIVWDSKISKPGVLIITADGESTLVCIRSAVETARHSSYVEDIRTWNRLVDGSYADAIHKVLVDKKLGRGRIGMELGTGFRLHMTHDDYLRLMELLAGQVVDAAPVIWPVRNVKSSLELELVRRVCDINVRAFASGFNSVKEGTTERDLFRFIAAEMFRLGADEVFPLGLRAGPDRYSQGNCPPCNRPIGRGEIIMLDGGPGYHGYYSDIIREACIGEPSAQQRDLFDFAVSACEYGVSLIRPGVTAAEVATAVDRFVDNSGYAGNYASRGGLGHALGLDIHEPPMIDVGNEQVLVPGMVLAIEPSFYEPFVGKFGIEENVVVTEDGYELLTPLKRDLWVI